MIQINFNKEMGEISDTMFVKEMQILWQYSDNSTRTVIGTMIRNHFDEGIRADKIIFKLQDKIDCECE